MSSLKIKIDSLSDDHVQVYGHVHNIFIDFKRSMIAIEAEKEIISDDERIATVRTPLKITSSNKTRIPIVDENGDPVMRNYDPAIDDFHSNSPTEVPKTIGEFDFFELANQQVVQAILAAVLRNIDSDNAQDLVHIES